jgi:hypothetical protein
MNYSNTLKNPLYLIPPDMQTKNNQDKGKKNETLFHIRDKVSIEGNLKKPFTRVSKSLAPFVEEDIGKPPAGFKATTFRLTTTKGEMDNKIVEKQF